MSLYRRGKTWYYNFRVDGKRYRGSTGQTREAAAKKVESLLMGEAIEKGAILAQQRSPVLRDFAIEFLNWIDNSSLDGDTKRYYKNGWRLLQTTNVTGMRLRDITTDAADALKFPASVFNANNAFRTLRRMLNKAKEWNKLRDVPIIKLRKEYRRERMMEPEEEVKILAVAKQPLRDVIIAILDGGMRPGEVFSMRWEHVNWNRGTYFNPKGKSAKARRVVFLSDRLRSVLQARWKEQLEGWVFPSKRSRCGHIVSVERQFLDARKEANIGKEVVLYCARHTFGTIAMEHTKNPAAVKDAMGHEDLKTTLVYLHPDLSVIREVINRKNAMLESIATTEPTSTTTPVEVLSFDHKSGHNGFGVNSRTLAK